MNSVQPSVSAKVQAGSIWQNRNFMILLLTGSIIALGSKVYELALPLILYDLTKSSVAMSAMRGIEFLPNLLLAVFIGVIVDRVNKKRWSLWAIIIQIMVLIGLFSLIEMGIHHLFVFYISGFILMASSYAYFNARFSIVKQALPGNMLTSANASFSFVSTLVGIMVAISGAILLLADLDQGLLITAVAFGLAFISLLFLNSNEAIKKEHQSDFLRELKEGWTELRRNETLWLITILVIFINSTAGMADTMIIFYAKDKLALNSSQLGIVLASTGLGGLVGSSTVKYVRSRIPMGVLLGLTTLLLGIAYLVMFLSSTSWILGIGLFFDGVFATISSVCIWTFRQESTPEHLIGRISGLTGSIFKLGMPFAIFAAGWIADWLDPQTVFLLACIFNFFIFVWYQRSPLWKVK
ncbi:MFS transporter [Neobacillus sp. PS3-34]|uniref:MFS transporter n=1 Tax=Neobacillus sp. PS3-34 TaxID=3070678 RepID=UPI0027DF7B9E|nr:MFS transporter [Neobacillus sp. PS3-34]WML47150.1 MFS transporter [Neobacillus sp. PS3-34]